MNQKTPAEQARDRLIAALGGAAKVAELIVNPKTGKPISDSAVYQWRVIPLTHVPLLAEKAGWDYHAVRPDHYPRQAA